MAEGRKDSYSNGRWSLIKNMSDHERITDEDKMIQKLTAHKSLISWVLDLFHKDNISSERTYKNDPRGDIYYPNDKDTTKVKEIVRDLNKKFNKK